jgi:hypothetical protein
MLRLTIVVLSYNNHYYLVKILHLHFYSLHGSEIEVLTL